MKNIIIIFIFFSSTFDCSAQKNNLPQQLNGTFESRTNKFNNHNYLRTYFLNDSTFLFTIINAFDSLTNDITPESNDLRLNGYSFFGLARLIRINGISSWIGISDFTNSFFHPSNPAYFLAKNESFRSILQMIADPELFSHSGLKYNVYNLALMSGLITLQGIAGVTRFFEEGVYKKIDGNKMKLGLGRNDGFYHKNFPILTPVLTKQSTFLFPIPITDPVVENKNKVAVSRGAQLLIPGFDFMNFTYAVQLDSKKELLHSGWVERDQLQAR